MKPIQQAPALEVDFVDKLSFLRYLDSNETKINQKTFGYLPDKTLGEQSYKGSQTYLKYLP